MIYEVIITATAQADLRKLKKSEPNAYKKACFLIEELHSDPTTGTGKPEQLKGNFSGFYSRRITAKHRLVYSIEKEKVIVSIISAYGHYFDK